MTNHLGRRTNVAKALYRGLVLSVLERGKIQTTLAKAKSVQGEIDKVVNWLKDGSVNARRQIVKTLGQDVKFKNDFTDRTSGHTRIIRVGQRFSDAAELVNLELIVKEKVVEPVKLPEPVKEIKAPKKVKKTK